MALTAKQQRFVIGYLTDLNATHPRHGAQRCRCSSRHSGSVQSLVCQGPRGKLIEVVRAIYTPDASAEQLSMFGLKPEDLDSVIELWSPNIESFTVFNSMSTQWRTGMDGPTGPGLFGVAGGDGPGSG